MVGKKRWCIFELCLVRSMLNAKYSFQDVVDHFITFFPDARHKVGLTSVKHVEKEYLCAEPYVSLDAHWSDIPGKKGYLLGLYALGCDFSTIAHQIGMKYPNHKWPERHSKIDHVDMAISIYHSCCKIMGTESLVQSYPSEEDALPAGVLMGYDAGDEAEQIYEKTGREVPFDTIVFILTRYASDFWMEFDAAAGPKADVGSSFAPIELA